jgi:hypothetical protein
MSPTRNATSAQYGGAEPSFKAARLYYVIEDRLLHAGSSGTSVAEDDGCQLSLVTCRISFAQWKYRKRQIIERVLERGKTKGIQGTSSHSISLAPPTVLRKVRGSSGEKMPLIQRLRESVPNGRSPEVWRKGATRERQRG